MFKILPLIAQSITLVARKSRSRLCGCFVEGLSHPFWVCSAAALCLSLIFTYSQGQLQVGYAVVTPSAGGSAPVATALFSYTNASGVLLWEAGVGATEPIRSGRIFVERSAKTRTALALANTAALPATVTFVVRDASGQELGSGSETFAAGQHRATARVGFPATVEQPRWPR